MEKSPVKLQHLFLAYLLCPVFTGAIWLVVKSSIMASLATFNRQGQIGFYKMSIQNNT